MGRCLVALLLLSLCAVLTPGCAKNAAKGKGTTEAETADVQAKMKGAMSKATPAPPSSAKSGG